MLLTAFEKQKHATETDDDMSCFRALCSEGFPSCGNRPQSFRGACGQVTGSFPSHDLAAQKKMDSATPPGYSRSWGSHPYLPVGRGLCQGI